LREHTLKSITHPEDWGADLRQFEALVSGATDTYQTEKRFIRADGSVIWMAVSASMVRDDNGKPLYGIRIVQDITELKRGEARQKFLLDELNHRVKNMLATVQSVAMQTRRNAPDLDAFTAAFEGRLMALNRRPRADDARDWHRRVTPESAGGNRRGLHRRAGRAV
jgi:hypothetical protein